MKIVWIVGVCLCLTATATELTGGSALTVKVSPPASPEPAVVSVRATIEASDDNRALLVIADSGEFYRSSEVPLEGLKSPRISVVELRFLPSGDYDITTVLIGSRGRRAIAANRVIVVPSLGDRR